MTKDQAKIVILEAALMGACHLVEFLHNCLTVPEHCKYGFPESTLRRLEEWKTLLSPLKGCGHLGWHKYCGACEEHRIWYARLQEAEKRVTARKNPQHTKEG